MKTFKKTHKDINKGEDVNKFNTMFDKKKKKFD